MRESNTHSQDENLLSYLLTNPPKHADKRIRTFTTFLLDGLASHCDTITPYLHIPPVTASTPQSYLVEFHTKTDNDAAKVGFLFCTWQIGLLASRDSNSDKEVLIFFPLRSTFYRFRRGISSLFCRLNILARLWNSAASIHSRLMQWVAEYQRELRLLSFSHTRHSFVLCPQIVVGRNQPSLVTAL